MSHPNDHIDPEPLDEVADALALTLELLEEAITDLKTATAQALKDELFEVVEADNARIREIRVFTGDLEGLLERWEQLTGRGESAPAGPDDETQSSHKRYFGRVKRGTKTPEAAYRIPILEVLNRSGGSLNSSDALDQVLELMADRLTPVDLETLPSRPNTPRWRNTAAWSRNVLANEGKIDRSVRGIWTITDKGRRWLEDNR